MKMCVAFVLISLLHQSLYTVASSKTLAIGKGWSIIMYKITYTWKETSRVFKSTKKDEQEGALKLTKGQTFVQFYEKKQHDTLYNIFLSGYDYMLSIYPILTWLRLL